MRATSHDSFPRGILIAAAVLIGMSMLLAAAGRLGGLKTDDEAPATDAVATLDLRFEDRAAGGVSVVDDGEDRVVATIEPGEGGFIRGVLRALVRERRSMRLGPEAPFRLTRWSDGRLSIEDIATGERVHVEAFGPTQVAAFARLMTLAEDER